MGRTWEGTWGFLARRVSTNTMGRQTAVAGTQNQSGEKSVSSELCPDLPTSCILFKKHSWKN